MEEGASLVGTRFEVEVGPPGHGGFCVARHEGLAIFVRHALPGERVVAEVTEGYAGDRYLRADAVEILRAAPERVEPPCPYAGPGGCGGCDWQHATPEGQRALKAAVVAEQLHRLAGLDVKVEVEEAPGTPDGLGWRTRVQFAVDRSGALGLRRHRSHDVVPVEQCLIASPGVEEVGAEGRTWPGTESVEVVAATGSSDRAVIVTTRRGAHMPYVETDVPVSMLRVIPADSRHRGAKPQTQRIHGRGHVREVAVGRTWRVAAGGFWQVHPAAPELLTNAVLDYLEPESGEYAADLYCGVGLFAGALAEAVGAKGYVVAMESDQRAIEDARHNLESYPNVDLAEGRVERMLANRPDGFTADVVVLDPPRAGAGRDVVAGIAELEPRSVAYVACDPAALARDVSYFAEHGYELAGIRAFDLFPMTHHVECVAHLRR